MKNQLNARLINAMSDALPAKMNLANFLTKELLLSREAAYRRLRGEVPFGLDETAQIAMKLNLSIDNIIGNHENSAAMIHMNLNKSKDAMVNYELTMERFLQISKMIKDMNPLTFSCATNLLPFVFCEPYEYINKFRISRRLHLSNKIKGTGSLADIEISENTLKLQKIIAQNYRLIPNTIFIWDTNIILSFIKMIQLFYNLRILSKEDIKHLKNELHTLMYDAEEITNFGKYRDGGNVNIYLSNINLEASYGYLESDNFCMSTFRVYAINIIDSQHPDICRLQKNWILSLRRYATLITESCETERLKFFNLQHEYIDSI
ncbi:MAG: hypothetical protein LBH58_12105 [Tannerellaceae bacterium]|jgi:hypothetical protein|nr:hypothetical protein [Tannerellaceae bacterium]